MISYDMARMNMVNSQLLPNGVLNPGLIEAFAAIPRDIFVPHFLKSVAYSDMDLNITSTRVMLAPTILGKMIEALEITSEDNVLCVGGDTGYSAAILAWISNNVTDLECNEDFTPLNKAAHAAWSMPNITRILGDLRGGAKSVTDYDAILVNGAVSQSPYDLALHLKPLGRMVAIIVPDQQTIGTVYLFQKTASGHVSSRPLFDAKSSYLPGFEPSIRFAFA